MERPNLEARAEAKLPDHQWKKLLVAGAALQDAAIHPSNNLFNDIWVEIGVPPQNSICVIIGGEYTG